MMVLNLTIVIPTHNRHKYLARIMDYYQDVKYKILIADSSDNKYALTLPKNAEYHHFPKANPIWKIDKIVQLVTTPYMFFCADDDFFVKDAIQNCIDFLEANPDYSSVQGRYISFDNFQNLRYLPCYMQGHSLTIDSNIISERLNQLMGNYCLPLFYAMHRTPVIQRMFGDNTSITHGILNELAVNIYSLIYGKYKTLDIFSHARDSASCPVEVKRDSLKDISEKKEFRQEYSQFKSNIIQLIKEHDENLDGEKILDHALSLYIGKTQKDGATLRDCLKKFVKKYLYFLMPAFRYFIQKKRNKMLLLKTRHLKGYPHTDKKAEKAWLEIRSIVKKHNIS